MNLLSNRKVLATALAFGVVGAAGVIAACSGSNATTPGGTGGDGGGSNAAEDGGAGVNNTTPGSCASSTIPILFSPMYSAFVTDSTAQTFQVPAVTDDGNSATWSSSDPSSVQLAADSTTGGVMITMKAVPTSGTVTIFAAEGSACGASTLNITSNVESDWTIGNGRYNDGVAVHIGVPEGGGFTRPDGGFGEGGRPEGGGGGGGPNADAGSFFEVDGGTACVNCHGPVQIGNSGFSNVAHTPEQTGGFSDSELVSIIVDGVIPDGGYFDPTVLNGSCTDAGTVLGPGMPQCGLNAYREWQAIHRWVDITADEQPGIICYLRSLTPVAQGGSSDFGGQGGGDGGIHHHHDGGGGPPPTDSGSTTGDDAAVDATGE